MGKFTLSEKEMLHERHCRKCGKEIYVTPQWVYKDPWGYYCSWKCFNHRFDGIDRKQKEKLRKLKKVEQLTLDGDYIQTFDNAYDAAVEVDGLFGSIRESCRKYADGTRKKYKGYLWRYAEEGKEDSVKVAEETKVENDLMEGQ